MRLLIWTQYFWPENFQINKLAQALKENGVQVTVVTGKPNYPKGQFFPGYKAAGVQYENYDGIDLIRLPMLPRLEGRASHLIANYVSFILSGYGIGPLALRGRDFDAVLVYAPSPLLQVLPAIFISWLKKAPLVVWVQDLWPQALQATGFVQNRCLLRVIEVAVGYIYKYSDSILIQSEAFKASIQSFIKNNSKIVYFPNVIEDLQESASSASDYSELVAQISNKFSVVFAGNIGHAQSCETIIAAAELLREYPIDFYLVGSGSKDTFIATDIQDRKITNVIMTGQISPDVMPQIYSAATVLLITLKNDVALSVTVPSKLQTYFAAGKPIIASLNGEAARLVCESNSGLTCPAEDAAALAEAVLELYHLTPIERAQLGKNGYDYFKQHFHIRMRTQELRFHLEALIKEFNQK
jgi:glycosyltransferase involved in cell wall biosynthesis